MDKLKGVPRGAKMNSNDEADRHKGACKNSQNQDDEEVL